ncbi:hypothetical protein [Aquimarina pacifica]|uniref:hypothetical protein n=1 Tax=Aquimarina pacifica TaxID=1296415 RepID=UPI00047073C7|nr:hypothetical protein [Aquimarina pacifica]
MKNFRSNRVFKILFIYGLGLLIASCSVEDGDIGPAGQDGLNGIDGTDGTNGIDGVNGEGFDELVEFGDISIQLAGTRPDNKAFTATDVFRFMPQSSNVVPFANSVVPIESEESGSTLLFTIGRLLSAPDDNLQSSAIITQLSVTNPGSADQTFELNLQIFRYAVIADDLTFFDFSNIGDNQIPELSNVAVTDFSFDSTTNAITFSFTADIPADNNTSGHEVAISGQVNAVVFEEILIEE